MVPKKTDREPNFPHYRIIRRKDSSLAFVSSSLDLSRRTFSSRGGMGGGGENGGAFAPIAPPPLPTRLCDIYRSVVFFKKAVLKANENHGHWL